MSRHKRAAHDQPNATVGPRPITDSGSPVASAPTFSQFVVGGTMHARRSAPACFISEAATGQHPHVRHFALHSADALDHLAGTPGVATSRGADHPPRRADASCSTASANSMGASSGRLWPTPSITRCERVDKNFDAEDLPSLAGTAPSALPSRVIAGTPIASRTASRSSTSSYCECPSEGPCGGGTRGRHVDVVRIVSDCMPIERGLVDTSWVSCVQNVLAGWRRLANKSEIPRSVKVTLVPAPCPRGRLPGQPCNGLDQITVDRHRPAHRSGQSAAATHARPPVMAGKHALQSPGIHQGNHIDAYGALLASAWRRIVKKAGGPCSRKCGTITTSPLCQQWCDFTVALDR